MPVKVRTKVCPRHPYASPTQRFRKTCPTSFAPPKCIKSCTSHTSRKPLVTSGHPLHTQNIDKFRTSSQIYPRKDGTKHIRGHRQLPARSGNCPRAVVTLRYLRQLVEIWGNYTRPEITFREQLCNRPRRLQITRRVIREGFIYYFQTYEHAKHSTHSSIIEMTLIWHERNGLPEKRIR